MVEWTGGWMDQSFNPGRWMRELCAELVDAGIGMIELTYHCDKL